VDIRSKPATALRYVTEGCDTRAEDVVFPHHIHGLPAALKFEPQLIARYVDKDASVAMTAILQHRRSYNDGIHGMALVVFFRGINVGGYRRFRPSTLARELAVHGVVNVGAAGTLVVRRPGARAEFLAELRRKLPFEAGVAVCSGSDLIRLETENPFAAEPSRPDVVRFVSILSKAGRCKTSLPIALPEGGDWFVRIIGARNRLVFGVYRRHMKTIGYLGRIDELFGAPATTRSWSTILSVVRILKA
jgi:uncharacterized protein (DUF1697 family)